MARWELNFLFKYFSLMLITCCSRSLFFFLVLGSPIRLGLENTLENVCPTINRYVLFLHIYIYIYSMFKYKLQAQKKGVCDVGLFSRFKVQGVVFREVSISQKTKYKIQNTKKKVF